MLKMLYRLDIHSLDGVRSCQHAGMNKRDALPSVDSFRLLDISIIAIYFF